jgi:hypothetical protein
VTRGLDLLKDGANDLFDKVIATFESYRSDPLQGAAMLHFSHYVSSRLHLIKFVMTEGVADDRDDLF